MNLSHQTKVSGDHTDSHSLSDASLSQGKPALNAPELPKIFTPVSEQQIFERHPSLHLAKVRDSRLNPAHFTLIDHTTVCLMEMGQLVEAVDGTRTTIGNETLLRTFRYPQREPAVVAARQEAVRELEVNDKFHDELVHFLSHFNRPKGALDNFITPRSYHSKRKKQDLEDARDALDKLKDIADSLSEPQSPYLKTLVDQLKVLDKTRTWELFHGPICGVTQNQEQIVIPRHEANFSSRILDRYGWPIAPRMGLTMIGAVGGVVGLFSLVDPKMAVAGISMLVMFPLLFKIKADSDQYQFYSPLARSLQTDPGIARFMDSVGYLDEMCTLVALGKRYPDGGCFPEIKDAPVHYFEGEEVHNPYLALTKKDSIANNFDLGDLPWGFTGPNSGGKSTAGKTVCQHHPIALAGGRVPAKWLKMGIPDRIYFQAQALNTLDDTEGRFGTELKESATVLDLSSPKTVRIFDELAQGTTRGESDVQGGNIIRGQASIGGTVIFITHAFELVEELAAEGAAVPKCIEFKKGVPTHQVIEGISRYSNSDKVAARLGMDAKGIEARLAARGIPLRFPLKHPKPPSES